MLHRVAIHGNGSCLYCVKSRTFDKINQPKMTQISIYLFIHNITILPMHVLTINFWLTYLWTDADSIALCYQTKGKNNIKLIM